MPELPEKCPVCGAKVEKGHVSTSDRIWWSVKETSPLSRRGDKLLVGGWSGTCVEAYRCPNCKIVLFSYGEEKPKE